VVARTFHREILFRLRRASYYCLRKHMDPSYERRHRRKRERSRDDTHSRVLERWHFYIVLPAFAASLLPSITRARDPVDHMDMRIRGACDGDPAGTRRT